MAGQGNTATGLLRCLQTAHTGTLLREASSLLNILSLGFYFIIIIITKFRSCRNKSQPFFLMDDRIFTTGRL